MRAEEHAILEVWEKALASKDLDTIRQALENAASKGYPIDVSGYQTLYTKHFEAIPGEDFAKTVFRLINLTHFSERSMDASDVDDVKNPPEELGDLDLLESLSFRKVSFDQLPSSMGKLNKLRSLILRSSKLKEFPEGMRQLDNLEELSMGSLFKIEEIPIRPGQWPKLEKLEFSHSVSLTELPEHLGTLTKLRELDLNSVYKLAKLPDSICQLGSLEMLDLSHTALQSLPEKFGQLHSLKDLSLRSTEQLAELPASFGELSRLEQLDLTGCTSLAELPSSFGKLKQLRGLDLEETGFEAMPKEIALLENLEDLKFWGPKFRGEIPSGIVDLPGLKSLRLIGHFLSLTPSSEPILIIDKLGFKAAQKLPRQLEYIFKKSDISYKLTDRFFTG